MILKNYIFSAIEENYCQIEGKFFLEISETSGEIELEKTKNESQWELKEQIFNNEK